VGKCVRLVRELLYHQLLDVVGQCFCVECRIVGKCVRLTRKLLYHQQLDVVGQCCCMECRIYFQTQ
jgi:hypothetical protein